MKIKRNASFKLFNYGKNKDKYQIRLRVTFYSQRLDLGTNCQLNNQEAWDAVNELVKAGYKGPKGETASTINDELRKCKDTIDMVFHYYEVNDKIPTPSEVQTSFKERLSGILPKRLEPEKKKREQKPKEPDLFTVFDEFTRKCGEKNAWTIATFEKMSALRADLQNFGSKVKLSELNDAVHPKWELVGTHTGRRTFIVQALSMGISPNIVMKWTGHSDYKAMKPYIDIVDSIKAQSMTKFNSLL